MSYTFENQEPEFTICPECGKQEVIDQSMTKGSDPYGVDHLKCGHLVICLGPNEPNVIIGGKRRQS